MEQNYSTTKVQIFSAVHLLYSCQQRSGLKEKTKLNAYKQSSTKLRIEVCCFFFQSDMFTMESVVRVQKAVTMPVYKNDAHNDVEVS